MNFCFMSMRVIPRVWVLGFAHAIAGLGYVFAGKQRKIALSSLSIAFGKEKSPAQIRSIAKQCFDHMAKSAMEIMFFFDKPALLKSQVRFEGREHLDAALARGKGAILVSAHFGNFPLMLGKLAAEGYTVSGIMRPMRDARTDRMFNEKRALMKIKTICSQPRTTCVETTLRYLRNNELVFIPMDQNFGTSGVFVDFFGTKAATATGPVVLAQRTKAALLPCFIVREKGDTHRLIFEPALELAEGATSQETLVLNVQKITDIIERYIRAYPQEWGWIHRRWKSRPS